MKIYEIPCGDAIHRIGVSDDKTLVLFDHDLEAEKVAEQLGAELPGCVKLKEQLENRPDDMLMYTAEHGDLTVAEMALEMGADLYAIKQPAQPCTGNVLYYGSFLDALARAAGKNQREMVDFLLDRGADVHNRECISLLVAADGGHAAIVKLLLNRGANAMARNGRALGYAAINGHLDCVKILLDHAAFSQEALNHALDHTLWWGVDGGNLSIVKLLLAKGANVYTRDGYSLRSAGIMIDSYPEMTK